MKAMSQACSSGIPRTEYLKNFGHMALCIKQTSIRGTNSRSLYLRIGAESYILCKLDAGDDDRPLEDEK